MKLLKLALVVSMGLFSSAEGAGEKVVPKANNDFAFRLFQQVSGSAKDNVFISPYSIYTALSMAYAGAEGNTKAEFEKVLGIKDKQNFHETLSGQLNSLNERGGKGFSISVANALWTDKQTKLLDKYTGLTKKYYGVSENQIDVSNPKESADKINDWVEDKTNDKIKDLVSQNDIKPDTRLIITNAIYFKGTWVAPFKKEATKNENFTLLGGMASQTPMMHMQKHLSYANFGGLKIVSLPYLSDLAGNLEMIVILPEKPGATALAAADKQLSDELVAKFDELQKQPTVNLALPKFKIETPAIRLSQDLKLLGFKEAFGYPAADFSGINGDKTLYISEVVHKVMIDVNEEGTEAAAATALLMATGAMAKPEPPEQFIADRPFIYLIRDNKTGLVLFIGKLLNPGAAIAVEVKNATEAAVVAKQELAKNGFQPADFDVSSAEIKKGRWRVTFNNKGTALPGGSHIVMVDKTGQAVFMKGE